MMTKGELRAARKSAIARGHKLTGELALASARDSGPITYTETTRGYTARYRWARRYDALHGAPESDEDR